MSASSSSSPPPGKRTGSAGLAPAALLVAAGVVVVTAGLLVLPRPAGAPAPAQSTPRSSAGPGAPVVVPTRLPGSSSPVASPPFGDPVLVGAGDIGRCDVADDDATAALVETLPGTVFTLGDTAYYSGSAAELRDCYGPSWGRLRDRTAFAVVGNHDYATDGAQPFRDYFGEAAARDGRHWYSADVGAWHVIVLDSNCAELAGGCGPDSEQLRWLRDDLEQSRARCTLAMWHHPRFSSGQHGSDPSVAPFWDSLYAAGADLVLNGHDHDYERFAPQDPRGERDRDRGLTQLIVGTGGAPLRAFGAHAPNSMVRSSLAHGVIELTLGPSGWGFRFVSTDGSFSDQGRGACH